MHKIERNKILIGICGGKQQGKSTTATYLQEHYQFTRTAFAARLKQLVYGVFGFLDRSEEAKERNVYCLVLESVLYREIKALAGDIDDVEYLYQQFLYCLNYYSDFGIFPCDVGFNITISPRKSLQIIGTNIFREYDENFWVDRVAIKDERVVIEDVRFESECLFVKEKGGIIIKIINPHVENNDTHVSEIPIPDRLCDYIITNEGSKELLYKRLDEVMENIVK